MILYRIAFFLENDSSPQINIKDINPIPLILFFSFKIKELEVKILVGVLAAGED